MKEEDLSAWMKLPRPLQSQYFENAAREAAKAKEKLMQQVDKMKALLPHLKFKSIPKNEEWKHWKIVAVDGSYSPNISERLGVRQGVYQAGCMLFEGEKFLKENYWSGTLSENQVGDPEKTTQILRLLCTNLERTIALRFLKDADLILIDGSFFGFRVRCNEIRRKRLDLEEWKTGAELVDDTRDKTLTLLNSEKALGIVKRIRTDALDGWLTYKYGNEKHCINQNDRAILACLMPENSLFSYKWLHASVPASFYAFNRYRAERRGARGSADKILEKAQGAAVRQVEQDLGEEVVGTDILVASRYYLRVKRYTLPMCIEAHRDVDINRYLAYLRENIHDVTGLPYPIDLIDDNVSVPTGFTQEFLEEIWGILIREHSLDPDDLTNYFQSINPQKEE